MEETADAPPHDLDCDLYGWTQSCSWKGLESHQILRLNKYLVKILYFLQAQASSV